MRRYFVKYPRNFYNEYLLRWVEAGSVDEVAIVEMGYERITLKKAQHLCSRERRAYKENRACAGYADAYILPYSASTTQGLYAFIEDVQKHYNSPDGYVLIPATPACKRWHNI